MATRRGRPTNLLARLKGDIALSIGPLTWSVDSVPADELARVSEVLLGAARAVRERFPELVEAQGAYHGGVVETADEAGVEEYQLLPTLHRRVGFRTDAA